MANLPPLANVRAFLAIAGAGRFNRAAEQLGLTESAVSHQLRKLEEQLGERLIERGRDRAVLTKAGQRFHAKAVEAVRLLTEAVEDVVGSSSGKVTITSARTLATHWLVPRYEAFQQAHPDIELQLHLTTRLCDLTREHIDLGIRYGNGSWEGLEAIRLFDENRFPVAAPHLAERWAESGWPGPPESRRVIVNETHPEEWRDWCAILSLEPPDRRQAVFLESFDLVLNAALAGGGLGMGRRPMVDGYLERGELVAPFGTEGAAGKGYFVVRPAGRPPSAPARAVLRWLVSQAGVETGH